MVRKAEFDEKTFILAAIDLIALGGPGAATMAAIAERTGAPTGSIYHRFKSRSVLLGTAWFHALAALTDQLLPVLDRGESDQAITSLLDWAEQNPAMARVIMQYTISDLIEGDLPAALHKCQGEASRKLGAGLSALLRKKNKALTASNLALTNFAIFDGPIAAMKPFLRGKQPSFPLTMAKCRAAALACGRASLELLD